MNPEIKIFPDLNQLTGYLITLISDGLSKKEPGSYFPIVLAGGSTPRALFELISCQYQNSLDWSRILLFWGDERCVLPSDPESNYRMAHASLLKNIEIPEANIYRIKGENDPVTEAGRYSGIVQEKIQPKNSIPQFDLILLGLGDDGHTASIFPDHISLFDSHELFAATEHPVTHQKRITATGRLINNAKAVCFIVTGSGKAEKVAQIIHRQEGWQKLPASMVHPAGELIWLLDEGAGMMC
ncbi:MAG: 6-phosphogluconolactonase [Bacteroidales bacterium]|nr:6-phosphogluconolactonase [Bacteroidales bacterium]